MKNCPQAAWSVVLNATFERDCLGMTADVSLSVAGTVKIPVAGILYQA